MRLLGIVALVLGIVFALLSFWTVLTTPGIGGIESDFTISGPQTFRYVFGPVTLIAAVLLSVGWIALRGLPRAAWLALLSHVVLLVPYLFIISIAPSLVIALVLVVLNVIVGPIIVGGIASLIASAVRRRSAKVPPVSYLPPGAR